MTNDKWSRAAAAAADPNARSSYREQEDYNNPEWVQETTRRVQQDSLHSSRRALRRIHETTSVAENNLSMLNNQSEQLSRIESKLDGAEHQTKINEARTDHLKAVNRFFMLPTWGAKSAQRREQKLAEKQPTASKDSERQSGERNARHAKLNEQLNSVQSASYYTTPDGINRDDAEGEIDGNLSQISSGLARLKMMGASMNEELSAQHSQLSRIDQRTESTRARVGSLNNKLERAAGSRYRK